MDVLWLILHLALRSLELSGEGGKLGLLVQSLAVKRELLNYFGEKANLTAANLWSVASEGP